MLKLQRQSQDNTIGIQTQTKWGMIIISRTRVFLNGGFAVRVSMCGRRRQRDRRIKIQSQKFWSYNAKVEQLLFERVFWNGGFAVRVDEPYKKK